MSLSPERRDLKHNVVVVLFIDIEGSPSNGDRTSHCTQVSTSTAVLRHYVQSPPCLNESWEYVEFLGPILWMQHGFWHTSTFLSSIMRSNFCFEAFIWPERTLGQTSDDPRASAGARSWYLAGPKPSVVRTVLCYIQRFCLGPVLLLSLNQWDFHTLYVRLRVYYITGV